MRSSMAVAALFLLAPASLAQTVWTVSSSPAVAADFLDIQPAIDAAADGDVILVRPGFYGSFEIDGKALTISNDIGSKVTGNTAALPGQPGEPEAFLRIRNLAAGQSVVLRGIEMFSGQVFTPTVGIHLVDNDGAIVIEDSSFQMFNPFSFEIDVLHGIWAQRSSSVVVKDTVASAHRASEGLLVEDSNVFAYGSEFRGGPAGTDNIDTTLFDGGEGASVLSGSLFASGCDFIGGAGFMTQPLICNDPAAGGNGVAVNGGTFRDLDCGFAFGLGGSGSFCSLPDAPDGVEVVVAGGTREALTGFARGLATPSPVYAGTTLEQTFSGVTGELVFQRLAFFLAPAIYVPEVLGPVLYTGPQFVKFRGFVGVEGTLERSIPLSDFGLDGLQIHVQPLFLDAVLSEAYLGAPTAVLLLDDALLP